MSVIRFLRRPPRGISPAYRLFSSASSDPEMKYLEAWQREQIKDEDWYEKRAEERLYFYHVDLIGRLFLESHDPKNIATSLKSEKFLRFFFRQVRRTDKTSPYFQEYPYYSPCGKEHNFIKPADTAIVFQDFLTDEDATTRLTYSGNLSVEFDPSSLRISPRTGRLYHSASETKSQGFGLVRSQLAVSLAETFVEDDGAAADGTAGTGLAFEWKDGVRHPILALGEEHENFAGMPPLPFD